MKQAMADLGSIRGEGALTSPQPHDITKIPRCHIPNVQTAVALFFFLLEQGASVHGWSLASKGKSVHFHLPGDC